MKKIFISALVLLSITLFTNKAYSQTIGEEFAGLFDCTSYDLDKTQCPECGYCFTGNNGKCPVCEDQDKEDQDNPNFTRCGCCKDYYSKTASHRCSLKSPKCGGCFDWASMNEHSSHCNIVILPPFKP